MLTKNRAGKVTSSECYKMFESKTVRETYKKDLKIFNLFKQNDHEKDVFNFQWGHVIEQYLHEKGRFAGYVDNNNKEDETIFNSQNKHHCGTPDQYYDGDDFVICSETKAPVTLKGLFNLIFPFYINGHFKDIDGNEAIKLIFDNSKEGKKYYYQILSNAILLEQKLGKKCNFGELAVFMPFETEVSEIREFSSDLGFDSLYYKSTENLPCIHKLEKETNGFDDLEAEFPVRNFHQIRFVITDEEKESFIQVLNDFTKDL